MSARSGKLQKWETQMAAALLHAVIVYSYVAYIVYSYVEKCCGLVNDHRRVLFHN